MLMIYLMGKCTIPEFTLMSSYFWASGMMCSLHKIDSSKSADKKVIKLFDL